MMRRSVRRKKKVALNRNELCHCGSGKLYSVCHLPQDIQTTLHLGVNCESCGSEITEDISENVYIKISNGMQKWHNYYKQNNLYKFSSTTLDEFIKLEEKEIEGNISKKDLLQVYLNYLDKAQAMRLLESSFHLSSFKERSEILFDIVEAHFNKKYTLSIPALFSAIEGVIRDIQGIAAKDKFQCKFCKEKFLQEANLMAYDNIEYFNTFINKLFEGQADSTIFNRNPIMHGLSTNYYSEEHSLILLLSLFEIASLLYL